MTTIDRPDRTDARFGGLAFIVAGADALVARIAHPSLVQLVLRIGLAVPFWRSGILKWDGFLQLNDTAVALFTDEFMLHLPWGSYPFPVPAVIAFLSGSGEIILPILLVLGLATRFAALGLLAMTAIIEVTIPDGWPVHVTWAAMALAVMASGPGRLSADNLICLLWKRITSRAARSRSPIARI